MIKEIISQITYIEAIAFILSIAQVLLSRKNDPTNYLFGIASTSFTLYLMFNSKLYAEFTLNIYYLIMSFYGWFLWKFGRAKQEISISYSSSKDYLITISIIIVSFILFSGTLTLYTDSDVPYWDAAVSAFAWAGMWLMAKRKIENWILLNISNIISIPLMIHKSLYLYSVLSGILFLIAISGYYNWKKIIDKKKPTN